MQIKQIHIAPGVYEGLLHGSRITLLRTRDEDRTHRIGAAASSPYRDLHGLITLEFDSMTEARGSRVLVQVFDTGAVHVL